jgi:hypothetical protein
MTGYIRNAGFTLVEKTSVVPELLQRAGDADPASGFPVGTTA